MSRKKSSVFSRTNISKVNLSTKIPKSLKDRADKVKEELKQIAPELEFSIPEIVESAVTDAVATAERELAQLRKERQTGTTLETAAG